MNAMPLAATRPLLDLLGGRWRVAAPTTCVAWDGAGELAGFALGDGTLAMAPADWEGAPTVRRRDAGGVELVAGGAAPPPVAGPSVHEGACRSVAADPDGGFLTGGDDGRVARVQANGTVDTIARFGGVPAALVVAGRGGWRACASGHTVHRLGHTTSRIEVAGPVAALALDPTGARLAIGHTGGVTLWAGGDAPRVLQAPGAQSGLAWSQDSGWLAGATSDDALRAWRLPDAAPLLVAAGGPVRCLAAMTSGVAFVAGVGGRVLCWHPAGAPDTEPLQCGTAARTEVTRVACHPRRTLIAAGYGSGAVVLCQPGSTAMLFLRGAGEGAVSALAFSPQGDRIAIGTNGGEIAVLPLPDLLFRDNVSSQ